MLDKVLGIFYVWKYLYSLRNLAKYKCLDYFASEYIFPQNFEGFTPLSYFLVMLLKSQRHFIPNLQ